jgi:anti-sigma B factor antagonist
MPRLITIRRQSGSITIVDLRGTIDLGEASLTLRRTISDLLESGRTKTILNFREVNSMGSAGLGELVGVHMPAKSEGGELKFLNPTKKVHGILQTTQLGRVFEIYTDLYGRPDGHSELFRSSPPVRRLLGRPLASVKTP